MMLCTESPQSVYRHLLLLTTIYLGSIEPAKGDTCRAMTGPVPDNGAYTWSIPLNPKRKSAAFDVQVARDFRLALVPDRNLKVPSAYSKYKFDIARGSNTWSSIGDGSVFNGAVLNANRKVALWVSWADGIMAAGFGKVVGQERFMRFVDPSPSPVNYMLIGGNSAAGNVTIYYCYDFIIFDRMIPVDLPYAIFSGQTVLDCGRQCDQDPMCVGYSVVRDVSMVEMTACNVYYSISGHQYDPQHVSYEYGNGTYPMY